MTRINCVPVEELHDKHLLAEYREMPRISALARRHPNPPKHYVLGTGHMIFFYDKGEYLRRRFEEEIVPELKKRNFNLSYLKYRPHATGLNKDWAPDQAAIDLNRARIKERQPK